MVSVYASQKEIIVQKKSIMKTLLEVAKMFEDIGIEYLHVVDLDGAKAQHIINHNVLDCIATKTNLKVDFGGGLKSDEDLKIAFRIWGKSGDWRQYCG